MTEIIDLSSINKLSNYINELEEGGRQARGRVIELADEVNELKEENENLKENIGSWERRCYDLEKENRKLKEDNRFLIKICKEYMEKENIIEISEFTELYRDDLEEENKNLTKCNLNLQNQIDKQQEKIQTLELWLDNKEKLNEEYRKQLDKYKLK